MKLESLKIAGFRGFNKERIIAFNKKLTLISAGNSYGKTSISEALEFLLYGQTSKVRTAESKEEYHQSYRNRHYPADQVAFIEARLSVDEANVLTLRVEIDQHENIKRYLNSESVDTWPFDYLLEKSAEPFVLQHALKNLLLVPPSLRFQGFARLLGLDSIDKLQGVIISLCTKPDSKIPQQVTRMFAEFEGLIVRLGEYNGMSTVLKKLKKGHRDVSGAYTSLENRIRALVGSPVPEEQYITALTKKRDDAAVKIFSGKVNLGKLSSKDEASYNQQATLLAGFMTEELVSDYLQLSRSGVVERLQYEAQLFDIGTKFISQEEKICPLCGQNIDEGIRTHISKRHADLTKAISGIKPQEETRSKIQVLFAQLKSSIENHYQLANSRVSSLMGAWYQRDKMKQLTGERFKKEFEIVETAYNRIHPLSNKLKETFESVNNSLADLAKSLREHKEDQQQLELLGTNVIHYLAAVKDYEKILVSEEGGLEHSELVLRRLIDELAGTGELAIAIELLDTRSRNEKAVKIADLLESLKELKGEVEQAVAQAMTDAISGDFTGSVMSWYEQIRTTGDPDIHFTGFEMEKTKTGDFKGRRLRVKAHSYGVELASAVSSLSESKLNALGLCVSIACALKSPGPWEFLVLDDPIQSWDDEHEEQFIDVIRSLSESKKQVILLSHKQQWINRVRAQCRSMNGINYEITNYTKEGPHFREVDWAPIDQRLKEADSIIKDNSADSVRLQHAEEEVRLAVCQIAAEFALKKLGREKSPHDLNKIAVRSILNESGVNQKLVDKIVGTFETTDDAHHAPKKYEPNRERLRQYLGRVHELKAIVNKI